ncbi:replication protein RepA [Rothia sp. ZJ932]|uniref:replication protein RepA n=1 Tax=Rothia sp. ZJ932 TaxID=2810516 RepID=UPI00196858AF|nr:replication protein RepA [Rothia sp. ZJ932]QRZ60778.1 hypothetical protein JR346_05645 [Rothia sp. ZJ932]
MENPTEKRRSYQLNKERKVYYPTPLISGSLPYVETSATIWERTNGRDVMRYSAGAIIYPDGTCGHVLPYGSYARHALVFLTTEAVRTGSTRISLKDSLRGFMKQVGLPYSARNAAQLLEQLRRIAALTVDYTAVSKASESVTVEQAGYRVGIRQRLTFSADGDLGEGGGENFIELSRDFAALVLGLDEENRHTMPIDLERWGELTSSTKSPLAFDLWLWLELRDNSLEKPVKISWEQLRQQFGSQAEEMRVFKQKFKTALKTALEHSPKATAIELGNVRGKAKGFKGLEIKPNKGTQGKLL